MTCRSPSADRVLLADSPLAASFAPPTSLDPQELLRSGRPVWISPAEPQEAPAVQAYRLRFSVPEQASPRVHVSADERYELWLDGVRVGRGPERASAQEWFYETYDLTLAAGDHVLVARVWQLGDLAPKAQLTRRPGFLLATEALFVDLLATGVAPWEVTHVGGHSFAPPDLPKHAPWAVGPNETIDARVFPWGVESGEGEGWGEVVPRIEDVAAFVGLDGPRTLRPAGLPAQCSSVRRCGTVRHVAAGSWEDPQVVVVDGAEQDVEAAARWQQLLDGDTPLVVPPGSTVQVVLDLGTYTCGYPRLSTSGGVGASVTVCWAEALHDDSAGTTKGHRDQVADRWFLGLMRDTFRLDGQPRTFTSLWWRAGRYVQLLVTTADEPLTLTAIAVEETRYPLEMTSELTTSDGRLDAVLPIALRALQMCAHETYLDCPYYEQLMYVGDTRLEALTTYVITADDRLPRKALLAFDASRSPDGTVRAHHPGRDEQTIPPFALWWVAMVHDHAMWRDDPALVRRLLPGVRAVLDGFLALVDADGLLTPPPGWNFVDWTADWGLGVPPDGQSGRSGLLGWHLVHTLGLAAELERTHGEQELAARITRHRDALAARTSAAFWDEDRGLFADDLARTRFSEHTQCLAVLSGVLSHDQRARLAHGLRNERTLTQATIYFTHYVFETYRVLGLGNALFDRLQLWFDLPAQGFTTTPEQPEPSRSDCHGWGAHPLFHAFATVVGARPAAPGFSEVDIAPLLGPLTSITASLVHPRGAIAVDLRRDESSLSGSVTLPAGVSGTFRYAGAELRLVQGSQDV